MIINKICVDKFGKLSRKQIEFKEGVNIIYGENEAGKSTMQAFIKAMLYGFGSKRSKSIKENERLKFTPLSGEEFGGEIILTNEKQSFLIKKSFGKTKKDDNSIILDYITGTEIKNLNSYEIGKEIFGLNCQSFENTLFIKQLGSIISKNKDDEVFHKVINMFKTGEDSVSYEKAKETLDKIKKSLTTTRKTGKLDYLKENYAKYLNERYKAEYLSKENIDKEFQLISLKERLGKLMYELEKLELSKRYVKKINLEKEYKEIMSYLIKANELKSKKDSLIVELDELDPSVNIDFLNSIKKDISIYMNSKNMLDDRLKDILNVEEDIKIKKNNMKDFYLLEHLPENIEEKIITVDTENANFKATYSLLKRIRGEMDELKNKKYLYDKKIKECKLNEREYSNVKTLLKEYEETLKNLKQIINSKNIDFDASYKIKKIKKENRINIIYVGVTTIIGMISFALTLVKSKSVIFCGVIILLTIIINIILINNRVNGNKQIIFLESMLNDIKTVENLKKSVVNIEERLKIYMDIMKTNKYEELIIKLSEIDSISKELNILNLRIQEKNNSYDSLNGKELESKIFNNNRFIEEILLTTGYDSLRDLLDKLKQFNVIKTKINNLEIEKAEIKKNVDHLENDCSLKEDELVQKLKKINMEILDFKAVELKIDITLEKLKIKEEVEKNLKANEKAYKLLLKNRDITELEEDLNKMINDDNGIYYEGEEKIEEEIKKKNQEILYTEKTLKDIEHNIETIFLGVRSIAKIEEDIEMAKEQIDIYIKQLNAIELARDYLDDSFKEMQKSFGPILNKSVADIFSNLTNEEYSEVKIDENYNLVVRKKDDFNILNVDQLSNGAFDQMYFALRLAFIKMLFKDEVVPIILDEAFIQYDERRLNKALDLVYDISKDKQIILFTCQKREIDYLKYKTNVNIITL